MKKLIILFYIVFGGLTFSCEESFLDEEAKDFNSGNNSFETYNDFNLVLNNLYWLTRRQFFTRDENRPMDFLYGTDLVIDGEPFQSINRHWPMRAAYDPTSDIVNDHWKLSYRVVNQANTLISRINDSGMSDEEKILIEARARFFRAFGYRALVYLYGGVPLVTEEVTGPKDDFIRATKEEVLDQVIEDLAFAANNLPSKSELLPGEVNNLAAYHYLAEVYIARGAYQEAVDAASTVIDDAGTALMQNRFGTRATEQPGDVYWDLFRRGNQNLPENTEAIWVIQIEEDVEGGGAITTGGHSGFRLERHHAPFLRNLRINGESPFAWPYSGYLGGRGIGWAISTTYFSDVIWQSDWDNDIRNANHNFVREFVANNPSSALFGDTISTQSPPPGVIVPSRSFYAYQTKATTPNNHPSNLYANPESGELKTGAGGTYTDQYMIRLAETYLLRAEAYLGLNNQGNAAADINVVRRRSNASDVVPGNVDIDYLLDERMRELGVEEKRRLTLMRLGLLYDRVKDHNPFYDVADGIEERYNVWPIPAIEIEANIGAELEQNPGYN